MAMKKNSLVTSIDFLELCAYFLSIFLVSRGYFDSGKTLALAAVCVSTFLISDYMGPESGQNIYFLAVIPQPFLIFFGSHWWKVFTGYLFALACWLWTILMPAHLILSPGSSYLPEKTLTPYVFVPLALSIIIWLSYRAALELLQVSEKQKAQLVQSTKMAALGEMAGGMAHEINNPLSIILGQVESLKRDLKDVFIHDKKVQHRFDRVLHATMRISKIILSLKTFSRDSGSDEFKAFPISQLVDDILLLCTERFEKAGVQLKIQNNFNGEIYGDLVGLSQVILNLLNNSFDAIKDGSKPWVLITTESVNQFLEIRIVDSGLGIPDSLVSKIMQPFFTTKEIGKGTGLGLSISKGIIEHHHGQFAYEKLDGHTCFVMRLPLQKTQGEKLR